MFFINWFINNRNFSFKVCVSVLIFGWISHEVSNINVFRFAISIFNTLINESLSIFSQNSILKLLTSNGYNFLVKEFNVSITCKLIWQNTIAFIRPNMNNLSYCCYESGFSINKALSNARKITQIENIMEFSRCRQHNLFSP